MALDLNSAPLSQSMVFDSFLYSRSSSSGQSLRGDREVGDLEHTLSCEVVHHLQRAEASAVGQLIGYRIHRPVLVENNSDEHRHARAHDLLALFGTHMKPFLAINPVSPLAVDDMAFENEHVMQGPAALFGVLLGHTLQVGA